MNKTIRTRFTELLSLFAIMFLFTGTAQSIWAGSSYSKKSSETIASQSYIVEGVVVEADGTPIVGASVIEKGTTNGITTDIDGKFTLDVKSNNAELIVSCIGFTNKIVKVKSNMKIVLSVDNEFLDEVVVVGYGTQKKANLTGAVSSVDVKKTLENRPLSDVGKALQGAVPGLTVLNSNGKIGSEPKITIRGLGTLSNNATSNPLIIVDGVPTESLSYLNPNDIENISVLKDAASSSIYGSRAAFGVVLITTKAAQKTNKVSVNYSSNLSFAHPTKLPNYPSAYEQMVAFKKTKDRLGATPELFGMVINDEYIKQAYEWGERHNWNKAGYRDVVLGDDLVVAEEDKYVEINGKPVRLQRKGQANYLADWDVKNIFFRKWSPSRTHNVSLRGTSGRVSYYLSFGYNNEEGSERFRPDKMKKWNVVSNVTSDVTDWLQVGARFSYNKRDNWTKSWEGQGSMNYIWRWGSFFGPYGTYNGQDFRPISFLKQGGSYSSFTDYSRLGGFAKIKILPGLTFNADYTYTIKTFQNKDIRNKVFGINNWSKIAQENESGDLVITPSFINTATQLSQRSFRRSSYVFNAYADYNVTFNRDHNLHLMAGVNCEEGEYISHTSKKKDMLSEDLPEFSQMMGDPNVAGGHSEWGTAGYFARLNYDYKGIYLLELNGRYDGSSRFPSSDRWAFFPSASLGYRMSEEAYFEPIKHIVNNAKLRASYGEIGNEAVGANMFLSTIDRISDKYVNWVGDGTQKVTMFGKPKLVSSSLKWERIQTIDLGADLAFLDNELKVGFDWYQRTTKDMLGPSNSLPAVLGAPAPYANNGTLRTRGWELSLSYNHIFDNDLMIYGQASLSDFTTEITKWANDSKLINSNYTGKKIGDIWGFETDRLFTPDDFTGFDANGQPTGYANGVADQTGLQTGSFVYGPGDIKYKDLNGDGVINGGLGKDDDHGDLKVLGNTQPRYQYSFRIGGSYKGFDIDMFFQGVGKRDVWTFSAMVFPCARNADCSLYSNTTDYWQGEWKNGKWGGDLSQTQYPRLYPGDGNGTVTGIGSGSKNFYPQSRYLTNMAYLRFKNLTIGYTIPKQLTRKINLEKVRVYVSAENLCELIDNTNGPFDPELGAGNVDDGLVGKYSWMSFGRVDPLMRAVSFGVQLTM